MFACNLHFAPVALDIVNNLIWCEGVGFGVGAKEGERSARLGSYDRCTRPGEVGNP